MTRRKATSASKTFGKNNIESASTIKITASKTKLKIIIFRLLFNLPITGILSMFMEWGLLLPKL